MDGNQPGQPHYHRGASGIGSVVANIIKVVWVLIMIVVVFLCIRFVLSFIGANPDNEFATFIYDLTYAFIAPFQGLLQVSQTQIGVVRIEYETLVAIIVYLLFGAGVTAIMNAFRR